jgi:hypothetical protein
VRLWPATQVPVGSPSRPPPGPPWPARSRGPRDAPQTQSTRPNPALGKTWPSTPQPGTVISCVLVSPRDEVLPPCPVCPPQLRPGSRPPLPQRPRSPGRQPVLPIPAPAPGRATKLLDHVLQHLVFLLLPATGQGGHEGCRPQTEDSCPVSRQSSTPPGTWTPALAQAERPPLGLLDPQPPPADGHRPPPGSAPQQWLWAAGGPGLTLAKGHM